MTIDRGTIALMLTAALAAICVATCGYAQPPDGTIENPGSRPSIQIRPMSLPEARQFFICKTHLSFDPGHGTQLSYLRADGAVLLWYPGNAIILRGRWKIEERTTASQPQRTYDALCYQYGANTSNPVTKQSGRRWECLPAHVWARIRVERADGDVFGLARRSAVPFITIARENDDCGSRTKPSLAREQYEPAQSSGRSRMRG